MKRVVFFLVLLFFSVVFASCNPVKKNVALHKDPMPAGFGDIGNGDVFNLPVAEGVYAYDFEAKDVNGKSVSLADYRGKWVFVDFWATWCGPCVAEMPNVVAMSKAIPSLQVIGISWDDAGTASKVADFAKGIGVAYPMLVDADQKDSIIEKYGVESIPFTVLIDPTGAVKYKYMRGGDMLSVIKSAMGK